jgi:chemotaxis protein CheX
MSSAAKQQIDEALLYGHSIDEAIDEVFSLMMGISCAGIDPYPIGEPKTVSAVIGLAGAMSGTCVLRSSERAARRMASALTGTMIDSLDDTVKDAIGELCNMIAGGWKGKLPALASACMLSTPTVVTGTNYQLHIQRPESHIERHYRFEDLTFSFTLIYKAVQ